MKTLLDKVKIWKKADGSLITAVFVADAMRVTVEFPNGKQLVMTKEVFLKGYSEAFRQTCKVSPVETEDQFIASESAKIEATPGFEGIGGVLKNIAELPDGDKKRQWRMKANGDIHVDPAVKPPAKQLNEKKDAIKEKLKVLGLSEDEAKLIVR